MASDMERRFLLSISVGNERRHYIDEKVCPAAMPAVLDLENIFELVVDCFDQGAFSEHAFVKLKKFIQQVRLNLHKGMQRRCEPGFNR
jgi:hypothetical protein